MNLLELYLISVGTSFSLNEYLIIKNNYKAMKDAKKNLKFRKNLSKESKIELNKVNKDLRKNLLIMNAMSLSFAISPIINIGSIPYLIKHQEAFKGNVLEDATNNYSKINEIEQSKKLKNRLINK